MEVFVFKTSVETPENVKTLTPLLDMLVGKDMWNFALDDCDRILRVISHDCPQSAIQILTESGFECCELEN